MSKQYHRTEPKPSSRIKTRARQLRQTSPVPERILWGLLRGRRLNGLKFRRQEPLGPYVADFLCEAAKLVVELDGESHGDTEARDKVRDEYVRKRGLTILRVPNDELLKNKEGVLETILRMVEQRVDARLSR